MFKKVIYFQCILFVQTGLFSVTMQQCISKDYGKGGTVCVCNDTYCDFLPKIQPVDKTYYLIYTSNKKGLRFEKTEGSFLPEQKKTNAKKVYVYTKEHQEIHGFGGAFTDSTGINVNSLNEGAKENLLRSYFGKDGIEYTLGRVPIGASDFGLRAYSYAESYDPSLKNFTLAPEDFQYKIPLIQKANQLAGRPIRLIGSAWSSPIWMKVIPKYATIFGTLRSDMYQPWANYHLKFLEAYKQNNVTFWGLTTGNQPTIGYITFNIPGLAMGPTQLGRWISQNLGPTLKKSEFSDLKIITLDDQRLFLPLWLVDMFLFVPGAKQYIDGIGVHWYLDSISPTFDLDLTHNFYSDKFIIGTEGCRGNIPFEPDVILGSWQRGEDYVKSIMENLQHWVTGWIDWNMALDLVGGPSHYNTNADSPIIVNKTAGEFYKQPMFYIMGHFSKFVPPGSKFLEVSQYDSAKTTVAFRRPDGGIAILIANTKDYDIDVAIIDRNKNRGQINIHLTRHSMSSIVYW
uniref:Glucosylceramidase n=2 Tax=Diabrotica virgifera virgifera TaxID=50390 RepID=A0A6P7FTB9_DIAVI